MTDRIDVVLQGGEFHGMTADKACNCQLRIDCPFDMVEKKVVRHMVRDCLECIAIYSKSGKFHKYLLVLSDCEVLLNENYEIISNIKKQSGAIKVFDHPFKMITVLFKEVFENE